MLTCSKLYTDFPFAHRAPNHSGHCALIHGHNWSFEISFSATERDENGFVIDFGKLKDLKAELDAHFDHTLVLNKTDPMLADIANFTREREIYNVVAVDDCSCEGIAKLVWLLANEYAAHSTDGRVRVRKVIVFEDSKNSACFAPVVPL